MKVLTLTVLSLLVQLGLAVLGWGGFAAFFSQPPFVALVVATAVMGMVAVFSRGNLSPGEREDRRNRWVFTAFGVLALLLAFVPAYTDRQGFLTFGGESVRWSGIAVYLVGGILRLWPVFVLGPRFSGLVAIQPQHELVTTGIYGFIRNPSYLGLLAGSLGWALTFRSGLGVLITALLLIPLVARIRSEERLLAEHFGVEYENYRKRTWRLIPGVY